MSAKAVEPGSAAHCLADALDTVERSAGDRAVTVARIGR
jgi:hypothetical protein